MRVLWIGAAGAVGAVMRWAVDDLVTARARMGFPWGTLVVNISGCAVLGVVVGLLGERLAVSSHVRAAVTVGFLGAYTTFSTFALETVRLADGGASLRAAAYVAVSVLAGLVAVWAGLRLGRAW